jgi:hypothetical protein
MNLTPEEQKLLIEVATILSPDMLRVLSLGCAWFSEEEEEKIIRANELAVKIQQL